MDIKITKKTTKEEIFTELDKSIAKALAYDASHGDYSTMSAYSKNKIAIKATQEFYAELGKKLLALYVPGNNPNITTINYDENAPKCNKKGEFTW